MKTAKDGEYRTSLRAASEANVNKLLRELHEKKRWLDMMIDGLEAAAGSPHHQLIETAGQIFEHLNGGRPKVDLQGAQQRMLADLASQVGRRRTKRAMRAESKAAARAA